MDTLAPTTEDCGKSPLEVLGAFWLHRQSDATLINELANHPSIYPHIKARHKGPLDLSVYVQSGSPHHAFATKVGGVVFERKLPGIYEMHTMVLPEARGEVMIQGSRQAFYQMFTQTECVEILTHCPDGNLNAKAGAKLVGMRLQWTADQVYPRGGAMVDSNIYGMNINEWPFLAPYVESIGVWFHRRLNEEYRRIGKKIEPHSHDRNHNKIAGAAVAMIAAGQVYKGVSIYNRWASLNLHPLVRLIGLHPMTIDIHDVTLRLVAGDMEICQ